MSLEHGTDPPYPETAFIRIDLDSLEEMLAAHCRWLASAGEEGTRANLRYSDLSGFNLEGANLRHADLKGARLEGTCLQRAALNHADLSQASGLLTGQLAGADLSGARLPSGIDVMDRLDHIKEIILSGRKVLFVMLLAVAYTWLTIATTSAVALLTNSPTLPLPIIMTKLPISGFYWAAPLLLLGFYIYLHPHLQRLWEDLAALPAFFPDGRALHDKVYPWLITGLVHAHSGHRQGQRPPMSRVQNFISIVLTWYVVPLTIAATWLRYLPRHDGLATSFHLLMLMMAVVAGLAFYRLAGATLDGRELRPLLSLRFEGRTRDKLLITTEVLLFGITFVLSPLLSFGVMQPPPSGATIDPRAWAPELFTALGYSPFANFEHQDVSTRPENWSDQDPPIANVKGALLEGRDLYRAQATGAFLVRANLREAHFQKADLELADLRQAELQYANLREASLLHANLRESNLTGADLEKAVLLLADLRRATLWRANLKDAFLDRADLRAADLYLADLRGVRFNGADLRGARLNLAIFGDTSLQGADLRGVTGLDCVQLKATLMNAETRLPAGLDCPRIGQDG